MEKEGRRQPIGGFQSHNTTSCTEMVEVTQNNSTSLIKFERQESNLSVIENTPQAKYPSYAKLLKSIPPQNHDAVSDMVIDETEYHTLSKHDSIEQLNKLCYDLNLGLSANETNKASDNLSKNNNNKIWCKSQSFSLLDIQSLRNVTNTVCSEVEAIKPITEEDTAMDKKTETENMILIDGALVQNDQSDENDTDESFAKKQELKADKIVEIRAKYTDMWNAMPLSERVSKRFVEKFQIRILEDPVDSLLDINYRPNLNSFYFPRVSQKELLCNLKESNDLSVQLSTILSTVSANMLQRDHIKNMKVAAVADKKISSQTSIEHFDMAVKKYEEGNEEDNQLDTSSTSSEHSPNHQWVKAYLNKAKTDIWKNLQNEELPIERLRWNEDLNEGETSEPDLTEDERFENMCRQIGTADWLNVKPDDL
ncbi:uncharacterized protein LOC126739003 isoform X2 [Anthonomus grandis grandis]|uniref:uncharacterized protein LOC126739003 isoform X2 n=1 Tax=Anthonomus grandis grandis TaxID=2921223 RepID=UPI002165395D|nr:uncharacterized protein LOC126739003 isoform X2 [Anthonomus grandis grandis]